MPLRFGHLRINRLGETKTGTFLETPDRHLLASHTSGLNWTLRRLRFSENTRLLSRFAV